MLTTVGVRALFYCTHTHAHTHTPVKVHLEQMLESVLLPCPDIFPTKLGKNQSEAEPVASQVTTATLLAAPSSVELKID